MKRHETLLKHCETSWNTRHLMRRYRHSTLVLSMAISALARSFRRYWRLQCWYNFKLHRCVTELLIMEIWVLFSKPVDCYWSAKLCKIHNQTQGCRTPLQLQHRSRIVAAAWARISLLGAPVLPHWVSISSHWTGSVWVFHDVSQYFMSVSLFFF